LASAAAPGGCRRSRRVGRVTDSVRHGIDRPSPPFIGSVRRPRRSDPPSAC
jgi:hypothetical protein